MEREVTLNGYQISYTLKVSKRAKRLRLAIYPGGAFIVTVPRFTPTMLINGMLRKRALWIIEQSERLRKLPPPSQKISRKEQKERYTLHKNDAYMLAVRRTEALNLHYGFTYARINIRDQKTRWGSCSKKGNLSFNYKIALMPPHLADYIIVHELCHLGAFDHSEKFWNLVAQLIPDHKERRKELRKRALGDW